MRVQIADVDYSAKYEITVEYSEMTELCEAKRDVLMKLLTTEGAFAIRRALERNVISAAHTEAICGAIDNSDISAIEKIRLTETVNE